MCPQHATTTAGLLVSQNDTACSRRLTPCLRLYRSRNKGSESSSAQGYHPEQVRRCWNPSGSACIGLGLNQTPFPQVMRQPFSKARGLKPALTVARRMSSKDASIVTLCRRYSYHPHFTDEDTEAWRT